MTDRRVAIVVAVLTSGVGAVATSFALFTTGEAFLGAPVHRFALESLPGWLVSSVVRTVGEYALGVSVVASGAALSVVVGSAAVAGSWLGARALPSVDRWAGVAGSTGFVLCVAAPLVGAVNGVVPAIVGGIVATYVGVVAEVPDARAGEADVDSARRSLVNAVAGVSGFAVVAVGVGLDRRRQPQRAERELPDRDVRREAEAVLEEVGTAELDVEGGKPLVTDVGDFFTVDINVGTPSIDPADWRLAITGLVEEEREFGYDDVRDREVVHQFKTIRCLSDNLDDDLLDTALWTGCRVEPLLEAAEPQGEYALLTGADDYFYSMPVARLEGCLLAYGMNGLELPARHGYPVRLLVPDRWGKLHVKWLTEIEIVDAEAGGYWEERGWHGMGPVNAVTKIDRLDRTGDRVRLVGHAYAGARGVDAVEVSTDGGGTWAEATLSEPLPDPDTARQWTYAFDPAAVRNGEVSARTIDGEGTVQPEARSEPFPDGATGWARRSLE